MKILIASGLESPRLEIIRERTTVKKNGLNNNVGEKELVLFGDTITNKIILTCENAYSSPKITRKFSYFEKVFQDFLVVLAHDNLVEKFKKTLEEEEGQVNEKQNIKSQLINYLQMLFSLFLNENAQGIKKSLSELTKNAFPRILWKKAKALNVIQTSKDDVENGFLAFVVISEDVANIKINIHNDKEIQAIIENIAYKNNLKTSVINAYYFIATHSDLIRADMINPIKEKISNGYVKVTLVPTNDYTKSNTEKVVYLNKLYSIK